MNFSTPEKIIATIRAGDEAESIRAKNRTKVTEAANFKPPFSESDLKAMQIKTNCNFGEMGIATSHARLQLTSAFLGNSDFFTVKIPLAPREYRADWEAIITREINRVLRVGGHASVQYFHAQPG